MEEIETKVIVDKKDIVFMLTEENGRVGRIIRENLDRYIKISAAIAAEILMRGSKSDFVKSIIAALALVITAIDKVCCDE